FISFSFSSLRRWPDYKDSIEGLAMENREYIDEAEKLRRQIEKLRNEMDKIRNEMDEALWKLQLLQKRVDASKKATLSQPVAAEVAGFNCVRRALTNVCAAPGF